MGGIGALNATPMLRLVSATVGPIAIVPGANGINQTVEAYNAGDASALSLTVSSSATWLTPNVGSAGACKTTTAATSCIPLVFALNTSSLAASATPYTGIVTVTAPNTVDAPQTITVTVAIGGTVPSSASVYVPPYVASAPPTVTIPFNSASYMTSKVTTQDGNGWLSLTLSGAGSYQTTYPYTINIAPTSKNTAGNTYTGSIVTSGSSFAPDNKTIAVTMNVTTEPIAQASPPQVFPNVQVAQGSPAMAQYVSMSNSGQGTLAISGVTASGSGIGATVSGSLVILTLDPTGLSPNTYTGSLSIASNAVNSPTTVPVTFQVVAAGAPTIFYGGVVDDAVFGQSGLTVTPGDIVALFGQQLSTVAPVVGQQPPLATTLGGASVTVNGETAPLYFSSYGQINFQIPVDTATGTALVQVESNGQTGNTVSLNVESRSPRLLVLDSPYGTIVDASQGNGYDVLPFPPTIAFPNFLSQPAKPGDVLTIYSIGLGPTSPAVASGQPAPGTAPLAELTSTPTVVFHSATSGPLGVQLTSTPSYAGLAPNFAGLYQINAAIPGNCPEGTIEVWLRFPDSTTSNAVEILVQ